MEYTFFWAIENYSYCWHGNGEILASPEFTAEVLEGTSWTLELLPRGEPCRFTDHMSLYLTRGQGGGPDHFPLTYELSILTTDGSVLCSKKDECVFPRGEWFQFMQMDEVLLRRKSEYLPDDTLILRCKMWSGEGPVQRIGRSRARTRIAVKKISFLHFVENFSAFDLNQSNTVQFAFQLKNECILTSRLFCTDGSCCEEKIMVEITSSIRKLICKCELFLLDASENILECGSANNRLEVIENGIVKLPLSLTKQVIMDRKSEYLTDDKLSLLCKCTFSTGLEFQTIEEMEYDIPAMAGKIISNREDAGQVPESSNALDDLKAIYNNRFLTDVELKTKTTSFSAHKIVLCARSPVFKAMLTSDMKEKNCNCIEIEDLDDDILKQLLLFLYCDELENLHSETVVQLYYAADKYDVKKLKMVCSQFLEESLNTLTAVELLLLSDTHSDFSLKQVVEDFILQHDVQVFSSDEWDHLIQTNSQLAAKTMQLKYKRQN